MPALEGKELRIVAFLCNWCSYAGADTAGVARAQQPTDLRIVRVPCSGRVNPLFALKALLEGADGVLVSGCHPGDCHYVSGNLYARRRLETLRRFLPVLGIDGRRFEYTWVSAAEGQRWQHVVRGFTERIHGLGPAPRLEDATPFLRLADMALSPMHPLGTGLNEDIAALRAAIIEKLPELDFVLGWQKGPDEAHGTPLYMKSADDVEKLVWGPFNSQNLAVYLPDFRGRKVGIVAKGCDSRSIVELLQENLVRREDVVIFGMPCEGTFDMGRVDQALGRYTSIDSVRLDEKGAVIVADGVERRFDVAETAQGKCYGCQTPMAVLADVRIGRPALVKAGDPVPPELALLDSMSLEERLGFWRGQMERCIRCYACRNACPMCVCRDYCVSDSRDPHWTGQSDSAGAKLFFQTMHAMHLAGRCTGCGECQRACPAGIPILALRQQISRAVGDMFDGYRAGLDPGAEPPLLGYELEEKNIREREW